MYSKNFGKGKVRLRSPVGTRECMSCGEKIFRGTTYLGSDGIGYSNICINCCAEAVFKASGQAVIPSKESEEVKVLKQRIEALLKIYSAERLIKEILVFSRKNS